VCRGVRGVFQLMKTPLILAAGTGHKTVVALLLRAGADFDSPDTDVRFPVALCSRVHVKWHRVL